MIREKNVFARLDQAGLFAAALALRFAAAAAMGRLFAYRDDGLYDDGVFIRMAESFLGRFPEPLVTHPPGYSFFLVPFLALGENGLIWAAWAQMLLGALLPVLIYRLCSSAGLGRVACLAAGALTACNPLLIFFSARIMSETVFALLAVVFMSLWLGAWGSGRPAVAAAAGLVGGLASLTRGVMLPFGGFLAVISLLRSGEQPRWAALVAACGLAWALAVAPWTVRNWVRFDRFIPVSLQSGWNLWEGMAVDPQELKARPLQMGLETAGMSQFEADLHFGRKAKAWIKENPARFMRLTARKALKFWRPLPYPPHPAAIRWAMGGFALLSFALALLGLVGGGVPGFFSAFLLAWAVHLTLLHAVFASNLRYRAPLEPFIAVYAGAGVAFCLRKIK
ncbi:MAG: glycosyltransferase family 39 protein [Elusimicrobia bacterium]|nr:glycosyltransferase family 39 protein [Elusimicrobiota bacterium]